MVERLLELCEKRHTNFSAVEKRLGFGNASLQKTNEKIQAGRLKKLADFFDVSMEYILTGVETHTDALSASERELLRLFRKLNDTGQSAALERVSEIAELPKYTQEKTSSKVG